MDKNKVAAELVKLAKLIMANEDKKAGLFDTAERTYDMVTPEQLSGIQRAARRYRGRVSKKPAGFGEIAVQVTFKDNFPESFATRDAEAFDREVKTLNLTRIPAIQF